MTSDTDLEESPDAEQDEKKVLDLKVDVTSPSACQRHVAVTIARSDIDRYLDEAVTEMMPRVNVPGFRIGRAPRKLVERHFRKDVASRIKGTLLLDSISQVTENEDFSAISEPDFDFEAVEVPEEGPMTFEFDIEVRPEFDLPQWKNLKLEKPTRVFTKEDVDQRIAVVLERLGSIEVVEGKAEAGDFVECDVNFSFEGKEVSQLQANRIRLRPTVNFIDGVVEDFDKLMVGAQAGDKKKTHVTLGSEAYQEELRSEKVDAEFGIRQVLRIKTPDLNEKTLRLLGDFTSEGEVRDAVKSELERQLAYHSNQRTREQITDLLTESASWELPPEMLKRQAGRELDRALMELKSNGFTDEEIQAHENWLRQDSQAQTAKAMKAHFILERIAEEEGIEATDADYELEIEMIAQQGNESARAVRSRLEKRGMMDALRNQIIERMVLREITEKATFVETDYAPKTSTRVAVDFAIAGRPKAEIPEAKHGESEPLQQAADRS